MTLDLPRVDIVLPCYNPQSNWHLGLLGFHHFGVERYDLRYIVVDDGTTNSNVRSQIDLLSSGNVHVQLLRLPSNRGKGFALREGVKAATAPFVVYTDIDFPFTDESVLAVIAALTSGEVNIVAGYREQSYYNNRISFFRKQLSRGFRAFIRRGLHIPVTDTQCGLKGFDAKGKAKFLATRIDRYLFDFEFIYTAVKDRGITIRTVPVVLKENVVFTSMRMRIIAQESLNLLRVLLRRR